MTTKKRTPVQIRWAGSNGRNDEDLGPLARWAREHTYWYAKKWPPLPGYLDVTEEARESKETKEALMKAIAIGASGIIAVREGTSSEQGWEESDDIAVRLETLIFRNMRNARKRVWKQGKCTIPIRIATITRGQPRNLDDENAFVEILDTRTMEEWQAGWKQHDMIEPFTTQEVWECLLPRTTSKHESPGNKEREDILRQALSPSTTHATTMTVTGRARAAGLRSVLTAMDGERGLHEEPILAEEIGPGERAIAMEAITDVCLRHLNLTSAGEETPRPQGEKSCHQPKRCSD